MSEFFQGIYFLISCWITVKFFWKLFIAFKTFALPRVIGEYNLKKKFGSWAVITGSTDGIGKAYAQELARRGLNIVLISRSAEKLKNTALEIENEFNVKTKIIVADFCDGPVVYEHIKTELENIPVAVLVNNVGMALPRHFHFEKIPAELNWKMTYVNISSMVMMTSLILPQMKERKKGAIINVSSASDYIPIVYGGLYSPSKALMKSFSEILQLETAPFGITVQLLSPFYVKTNMLKALPPIHKVNSIMVPDSEIYARHAIKTLGFSGHTSGYWGHGLWYFIAELIPRIILLQMNKMILSAAIRIHMEKLKMNNIGTK